MTLFQLLLVAIIQGLTEFLPISSSGHLILLPTLTGGPDQGLAIDVAVHVGTLLAVVIYFRAEVLEATIGLGRLARGKVDTNGARTALLLIIATIPVLVAGLLFKVLGIEEALRSVAVIGWTMLIFGIVLYWADKTGQEKLRTNDWNLRDAIWMGLAQTIALIPGTSRSGITITAARKLGYDRTSAATLSMLMSIPTILASGALLSLDVIGQADWQLAQDASIAAAFAFVAALVALTLMMRLLRSVSFTPYVIYRVILGIILLIYAYS
ncbi:MAG: undecaprenyl-diphosphate phosphatase [Sulfitobacter sp.]|jgi:undecaprenyl-diphosphatase|uniref:undecaprenyl-diphosphate phosphatase n=1 Tax=Sulfitobacter sp. TaxID=1903071 RepID=UPI000C11D77B|nr:undecaprenyl-diphosphate phosphatase [Roseobacter sp.]MBV49190.1 undecaprenyl-diphosphate phosphatase [Roseobacter sp.]PHR01149.1 MAG: undecaprenyl-diphosphate phosphatase [Sulfitobacter sp.]THF93292.1 MAG: undecaprenyl-diphosphate phosphatase [Sulfitobacter sp. SK025]|tara:strand:+ start:2196 stop:2999 length:804 start_codon:yes stop_codon:yes gene_type:complete